MCRGVIQKRNRREEIGDPWGVLTDPGERRLVESLKTWVKVLPDRREDTQSTI